MLINQDTRRPATIEDLLGRDLLARLDALDVISRKVFQGKMPGERRSKKRGQSVEFDDYRQYVPGDDLRHIDWNVLARLDKLFLKLFREEEDLGVHILLDASPSMDAGDPNKLVYASRLAMGIAYIGLVNQNRVSLTTFGRGEGVSGLTRLAPMRGRRNVRRIADMLLGLVAKDVDVQARERGLGDGPTDFHALMRSFAISRTGKGVLVLISDMLFAEGRLPGLNYLAGPDFDAYILQVLSPDEIDPARAAERLGADVRLIDAESNTGKDVTITGALLRRYKANFNAFQEELAKDCKARRIRHDLVSTDTPAEELLLGRLRRRGLVG